MTPSAEFKEYVLEHLEVIGSIKTGRFFGGVGISRDSVQFAFMMGNSLYFAVDDNTRKKYEQAGMHAFSYMKKTGVVQVRKYFGVPEDVLTDSQQLQQWANEAIQVAHKTQPKKSRSN